MGIEAPEKLPDKSILRARLAAAKILSGVSYLSAVRQVMINENITHEPDIQKAMREISPLIKEATKYTLKRLEDEEGIKITIEADRVREVAAEFQKIQTERGGDPDD